MDINKRERWIDLVKVTACLLVVVGHVLRGLISAGIISPDGTARTFITVIYYFHVNLFFFCSGWLFTKRSTPSPKGYLAGISKKLIDLGIPYVVFLTAGYILKQLFESSVNNASKYSYVETLFLRPEAPYWYLYALFFIFLISPPIKNKRSNLIIFALSAIAHIIYALFLDGAPMPYFLKCIFEDWMWFAAGSVVCSYDLLSLLRKKSFTVLFSLLGVSFIPLALLIQRYSIEFPLASTVMGVLGCILVITPSYLICRRHTLKFISFAAGYTLPVFLMHTLSAPAIRAILIKLSVYNPWVHFICGVAAGIAIPFVVAYIMKLLIVPEILLYPRKTIKKIKSMRH